VRKPGGAPGVDWGLLLGCPYGTWFEGFRRAWALASPGGICFFAADCERTPGEAKERPQSKKNFVIPGLTRNDEVLGCSLGVPLATARRNPFLCFAALCAGEKSLNRRTLSALRKT
jgi:hypothetical protein